MRKSNLKTQIESKSNGEYLVSVIIPVYNAEKTLERAFLSVKNQTIGFENIELLFCDDCSTDRSFELITAWAKEHSNVKAFQTKKNTGTAGAPRNVCLDNVTAPYIMFLDNDDEYYPDACETLYNTIVREDTDAVQGTYVAVTSEGEEKREKYLLYHAPLKRYEGLDGSQTDLYNTCVPLVWDKIFKKSVFDRYNIRFSVGAVGEDDVVSTLFCTAASSIELIGKAIVKHSESGESITNAISDNEWWSRTLDESYKFMISEAKRMKLVERYDNISSRIGKIAGMVGLMLKSNMPEDNMRVVLEKWREIFAYAYKSGYNLYSPESRIVCRDASLDDTKSYFYNFEQLRGMYAERKREIDGIYSSNTWKLAQLAGKLKFWSK